VFVSWRTPRKEINAFGTATQQEKLNRKSALDFHMPGQVFSRCLFRLNHSDSPFSQPENGAPGIGRGRHVGRENAAKYHIDGPRHRNRVRQI
jgi:hypothetical protein